MIHLMAWNGAKGIRNVLGVHELLDANYLPSVEPENEEILVVVRASGGGFPVCGDLSKELSINEKQAAALLTCMITASFASMIS